MASSTLPNPGLSPNSLAHNLTHLVKAAEVRSADAQRVFYPIANLWDAYLESDEARKLPTHLRKPLAKLCTEITALTNRHFESYIRGSYGTEAAIPAATTPSSPPQTLSPASEAPTTPSSYASVIASAPTTAIATKPALQKKQQKQQKPTAKPTRPDTRLFVRMNLTHPARAAGSFAILTGLKKALGTDAPLLKEVLAIPSGYALCTSSSQDLAGLTQHSTLIANTLSNCRVERPQPWVTYRLENVPRSVRLLDPLSQVQNHEVTDEILRSAVQDYTGQQPIQSAETRPSKESGLFNTSWTVHFLADGHRTLHRSLRILGTVVQTREVKSKPRTVQCTRCYQWHNSRTCSRPQLCNICGSQGHAAVAHTPSCHAIGPHECPPKCLHCKGPHLADDLSCPLRPVPLRPKTKPEIATILTASKAARKRAIVASNCVHTPSPDVVMASSRPVTPTQPPVRAVIAPPTLTSSRFHNPESPNFFSPLNED